VPQKNVPLAITALGRVPDASLVVIGDGASRGDIERALASEGLGERVTIRGAAPRTEVFDWLRAADAALLSSDWENFPHAAVEALAAGTPVIATAVGGVPEIIETGANGILVPPGDLDALSQAIADVATDRQLLVALRAGARAAAERYDRRPVFEAIEAALKRAVGS
jgi:glycosyltransferase involved in cell wall biosynthesis